MKKKAMGEKNREKLEKREREQRTMWYELGIYV